MGVGREKERAITGLEDQAEDQERGTRSLSQGTPTTATIGRTTRKEAAYSQQERERERETKGEMAREHQEDKARPKSVLPLGVYRIRFREFAQNLVGVGVCVIGKCGVVVIHGTQLSKSESHSKCYNNKYVKTRETSLFTERKGECTKMRQKIRIINNQNNWGNIVAILWEREIDLAAEVTGWKGGGRRRRIHNFEALCRRLVGAGIHETKGEN